MTSGRWAEVSRICQAALGREASERSIFLTAACGDDDTLRLEVEALLTRDASAARFLDAPVGAIAAAVLSASADAVGASHDGDLIDRRIRPYEIGSGLSAGGDG